MRAAVVVSLSCWLALCACNRADELVDAGVTDGGPGNLVPTRQPAADFAGKYSSQWGPVVCAQQKSKVRCKYTAMGAKLDCDASGQRLRCRWIEKKGRGQAKFTRQPNGNLVGTWGYGQSDENGGAWMLTQTGK